MEWMRCNSCWIKVDTKESMFHLTQCGHIFCNKCIVKAEERCCQCNTTGTISLPLKEPFSPQIAHYFTRPVDLLEKVIQAEQFQESQLSLCLKRANMNESKYQSVKEAYWVSAENLKKVYQKYNKLKMTVTMLQNENKKMLDSSMRHNMPSQYQTPVNQINNFQSHKNFPRGCFGQKRQETPKRNDEVFRVPSITKVPRSAGYFTASSLNSTGSSYKLNTSKSNFSNY